MIIYGAGLAGLLAANILRRFDPVIHEAQVTLPNNHEALLRFRTDAVAHATGIPFRRVIVEKCIRYKGRTIDHPDIQLNNLYSYKVTGEYHQRSISDCRAAERYIAPGNLVELMAKSVAIQYKYPMTAADLLARQGEKVCEPAISTIPMPMLMRMANWPGTNFQYRAIWSVWIEVVKPVMDLYQTIYYPNPDTPYYRTSITGNKIIIEFITEPSGKDVHRALEEVSQDFGIWSAEIGAASIQTKHQPYGKLLPIPETERRQFILAMTDEYRIYSLGRFSTWRQILMDDVVKDVHQVERWITERSAYSRRLEA